MTINFRRNAAVEVVTIHLIYFKGTILVLANKNK